MDNDSSIFLSIQLTILLEISIVCRSLMRLERLESISLGGNNFNKSIISCQHFLPSLKTLDLHLSFKLDTSFPMQGMKNACEILILRKLKY
ncbi:hypothetical protein HanIR_Chr04g0154701 [Helianthus annuus]|nr:hypothetical protein HanIR_Chr04g0154701 [Helianthus annuus]